MLKTSALNRRQQCRGGILTLARGRILYHYLATYDFAPGLKGLDSMVNSASMITLGETRASWNQGKEKQGISISPGADSEN